MAKRRKKRLPLILAEDEVAALLQQAKTPRDKLLIHCGIFLGLRVSELSKLRVRDVDVARGVLMVREGKGGKDRAIPTNAAVRQVLAQAVACCQPGDPVFVSPKTGRALQPRAMQLLIKRLVKAANLPDADLPRHYTPHKMRHYFATKLLEGGADISEVSELLGHNNIATTQVYLHVNPHRLKSAVDRLRVPTRTEGTPLFDKLEENAQRPLLRLVD